MQLNRHESEIQEKKIIRESRDKLEEYNGIKDKGKIEKLVVQELE